MRDASRDASLAIEKTARAATTERSVHASHSTATDERSSSTRRRRTCLYDLRPSPSVNGVGSYRCAANRQALFFDRAVRNSVSKIQFEKASGEDPVFNRASGDRLPRSPALRPRRRRCGVERRPVRLRRRRQHRRDTARQSAPITLAGFAPTAGPVGTRSRSPAPDSRRPPPRTSSRSTAAAVTARRHDAHVTVPAGATPEGRGTLATR